MFRPGVFRLEDADPARYTQLLFVCGPVHGDQVAGLHERFAALPRIAVGVTVIDRADPAYTGFDLVLARDGDRAGPVRDLSAAAPPPARSRSGCGGPGAVRSSGIRPIGDATAEPQGLGAIVGSRPERRITRYEVIKAPRSATSSDWQEVGRRNVPIVAISDTLVYYGMTTSRTRLSATGEFPCRLAGHHQRRARGGDVLCMGNGRALPCYQFPQTRVISHGEDPMPNCGTIRSMPSADSKR